MIYGYQQIQDQLLSEGYTSDEIDGAIDWLIETEQVPHTSIYAVRLPEDLIVELYESLRMLAEE